MEKKKSMSRVERLHREKVTRYSIRKVSFGAASVAVAALFMFLGNGAVAAAELSVTPDTSGKEILNLPSEAETLNKEALTNLIEEIEGKFAKGIYASKTEDSVNQLKTALDEAKSVLNNAKIQEELTRAYNKLVTVTTQLKTKPEEKKEAPAVDTTNGKATVSKVATNTEKSSESNSIANSGSKDERNGKAINKANAFRTDAATTDTDPAANQTYTAPAADADLNTLVKALLALDPTVENNSKLSQNMDSLGDSKEVAKGTVKEITEFGGWTAVDGGVFAIARRTEEGVYPLETINSTLDDTVWLQEQAFDRDAEYTLLLSKSITRANRDEAAWDGSAYKPTGAAGGVTKNVAKYKGIEKIFTAYSSKEGSDVIVKFKPGYVGDSEGSKANYKIQVYSITGNQETLVYETTFDPFVAANDDKKIVTKATDGTNKAKIRISKTPNSTTIDSGIDHTTRKEFIGKREAEKLMAKPENLPNGKAGTFTSKPIELPKGADHYKVRISLADQNRTGMSYQAWDEKYSIPVTGADFSIAQDTSKVARNLLQRIYDKLKATESADKNGKTSQTIQDYEAELEKVRTLLADPAARTANFKQALQDLLAKQSGLKTDKTGLTNSKAELDALINEDPTVGKTEDTVNAYNTAKEAAKAEITEALKVLNDESATPEQVSATLEKVNAKKAALQKAKDGLIEAATTEEKAKLKTDADSLVKADTTGKTPKSIEAYNTKYEAIKAQLEAAKTEAAVVLAKGNNASKAEVQAAQTKVDVAKAELTKAAELLVNKADKTELTQAKEALSTLTTETDPTTGKTADSAKAYSDAKTAAQEAIKEAETVINDENATPEQVTAALEKVNAKKTDLQQAKDGLIEAATTEEKTKLKTDSDALKKADTTGKTADSIKAYEAEFEKLKAQLEEAKAEADKVLAKGNNATKEEVKAAQAKVDAAKTALDKAAESLKDLDRDAAKKEIADAAKKATDAIEASTSLTPEQKADEKAKVAKEAKDATDAIDNATTEEGINSAKENGKLAIEKEAAITAINAEKAAKEQEIDNNTKLSDEEKAAAKAEVAKAATEAVEAIKKAATKDAVEAAKTKGEAAIKAVNPVGKEKALDAIQKAAEEKIAEIDKNDKLSAEEKAAAKAEVAKAAIEAVEAIQKAETQEAVNAAQEKGEAAIKAVNSVGKEKALDAIQKAAEEKIAEIDKNDKLSAEEKAAAKAEVAKAAIEAVEAIQKAETQEAVNAAQTKGETAIKAVNPIGKEKALEAIQTATEAKLAEIDKNTNLSAEEKAAAKAEVAKAAIEAVEAIQKAETQEAVNAAQAKGETAIKSVNPLGKEKALEAIKATRDAKLAEIDKATGLSAEEKAAAKAAVEKAYNEAVEAIQKAATQEAVNAAQAKGEAAIKAVNSIGKEAVNEAKAAVEAAAAEKIASIKANPNLSAEEKAKAIAEVERLKQTALNAIDKATTKAELDKALRTFLYQLDLESLVYDRPTFDLEAYIQASITGVVKVERGKAITQADIIAKLNLPENVTVISIDLPDTNTLGDKFAKVTLRLPDGTEVTVKVPVRVVAPQNGDSKPDTSLPNHGANNGTTNTDVKVDKAKLEGAIRQLDELIIQESAKLDAETAKEANDLLADAKKVFANADASQAEVDAMVKRIEDFMAKVAPSTDHATPANDQAAQTPAVAPSTTQAAANASQTASAQANTRTVAKELPNTGTADSVVSMVAAAASALLGLGLAGRRKEDEEA